MMKRMFLTLAVATTGLYLTTPSQASSILFDANLVSPASTPQPGWYNGTGNPNGGFTVVDGLKGVEIGLRAKYRQNPAVIDNPLGNVYNVVTGPQTALTSGFAADPTKAAWNYEFSIDVLPNGVPNPPLLLSFTTARLTFTDNLGHTATVDPYTYWSDDSGYGATGKTNGLLAGGWGAQNSENPNFGDFPLAPFYDMNANATYTIQLDLYFGAGTTNPAALLASDQIVVVVGDGGPSAVPVPAAAWAGLSTMAGIGVVSFMKRRRRNSKF